jgi:carboxyl-terminal processing protease
VLIEREGESKPIEKALTREEIKLQNVPFSGVVGNDVGYIKLSSFTQDAGRDVKEAFLKLKDNDKVKSIIIDLRGNGGGLLQEAVNIVNIFVDKGQLVVSTKGKVSERNFSHKTIDQAIDNNIPLVILVDKNSASASEIVSGALHDHNKATLIGKKSFGKGSVQEYQEFGDGTAIKVTVAEWFTPNGLNINKNGMDFNSLNSSISMTKDGLSMASQGKAVQLAFE